MEVGFFPGVEGVARGAEEDTEAGDKEYSSITDCKGREGKREN